MAGFLNGVALPRFVSCSEKNKQTNLALLSNPQNLSLTLHNKLLGSFTSQYTGHDMQWVLSWDIVFTLYESYLLLTCIRPFLKSTHYGERVVGLAWNISLPIS